MTIPPFDSLRNFGAEEVTEQDLLMEKNTGSGNEWRGRLKSYGRWRNLGFTLQNPCIGGRPSEAVLCKRRKKLWRNRMPLKLTVLEQ